MIDQYKDAKKYDLMTDKTAFLNTLSEKDQKELASWELLNEKPIKQRKTMLWGKIDQFSDIAWLDPFSNIVPPKQMKSEKKTKQEQKKAAAEDLKRIQKIMAATESKAKYESFAVPSRAVMFKIFRGCLGVERPDQLWIYELNSLGYQQVEDIETLAKQFQGAKAD